jgi:hypothetical protein
MVWVATHFAEVDEAFVPPHVSFATSTAEGSTAFLCPLRILRVEELPVIAVLLFVGER